MVWGRERERIRDKQITRIDRVDRDEIESMVWRVPKGGLQWY